MTYEETEPLVTAFVAQQVRNGACPHCLVKAMIGVAIDTAFDHDSVADVHALLCRCVVALDQCQSDQPDQNGYYQSWSVALTGVGLWNWRPPGPVQRGAPSKLG
jgi:hypothetical protein